MIVYFDPRQKLIRVPVRLWGPAGSLIALLLLDTGSEATLLNTDFVKRLGYDLSQTTEFVLLTTVSGVVTAPRLKVNKLRAWDHEIDSFGITCFTSQPRAGVDGILGLDFFVGRRLIIDFRIGEVILE